MRTITVTNHLGQTLSLELSRPEQSGLAVLSVNGLNPVKANIVLDNLAIMDGGKFNSSRAQTRNIVLSLRYYETEALKLPQIRYRVSQYFPLKKKIKLVFDNGIRKAFVYGYVESNEAKIFSKEAGTVVSILCEDSYLYDTEPGFFSYQTTQGAFTFPFSNESLTNPLLIMGEIELQQEIELNYEGEVPIGFLLRIHVNSDASSFLLMSSKTLGVLGIDSSKLLSFLGDDLISGDDIYISTVIGSKYARLTRFGITYNILDCLRPNPSWFQLEPGVNKFVYTLDSGVGNIDFSILANIAYEGM